MKKILLGFFKSAAGEWPVSSTLRLPQLNRVVNRRYPMCLKENCQFRFDGGLYCPSPSSPGFPHYQKKGDDPLTLALTSIGGDGVITIQK